MKIFVSIFISKVFCFQLLASIVVGCRGWHADWDFYVTWRCHTGGP